LKVFKEDAMLRNFTRALALEQRKGRLDYHQYWRYSSGRIPKVLRWLVEHPDLAQALSEDAAELAAALAAKTQGELIVAGGDTEQEEPK
jgi:hypothetical protein